jgi:hypothetical protein
VYSNFYKIPLPALHFEKTEEIDIKWTNTEERNDTFRTTRRNNDVRKRTTLTTHSPRQGSQNRNAERTTLEEGKMLPETEKWHADTKVNCAFQNGTQKNNVNNDAHENSQTTTRIWKTTGVFIREFKALHSKMTTTGGDDINLAPENGHNDDTLGSDNVDLDGHDDGTGDTTAQANVPAAPSGGNGPTNFNLRVEQNKIPEFFGAKSKDTISAADFIRWLEDLAKMNRWADAQTYHHFANSLRNPAREWLSSIVNWNTDENVRLVWSDFKDLFKQEYTVQTNDKLILEGLSNFAMKPNETTNELLTRITRTSWAIRESFDDYDAKIPYPHNDLNGGISNNTFCKFLRQYDAMWINFFKMNLFKAVLTPELRSVVAQQDQETITIKRMYQVATTAQRELKGKGPALVNEIREEEIPAESEADYFATFNRWGARPKNNQTGGQNQGNYNSRWGGYQSGSGRGGSSGSGNNSNRNGKYCYFCKIQGHWQEECRKRMKENKPCPDAQGHYYWPKVYFMEENKAKSVNSIDHEDNEILQNPFSISGLNTSTKNTSTRTATLPPQFWGFQ